ncbi:ribonuclease E/G family protein [Clostridium argentinense CDC 2741]|uniref:Ribonuclease E/G family protein n=1 Tax=Clostridium argentinense CDC 2741 TaxID=1418104 RepID=A0A0C1U5U3_9CLOT|nr:ribonuclease E/G [Clostridium argentinense]ARC85567.1 ribonuclease E/G [Clostridium argentinense]KIE47128.1 ribonuclease E/G family protein [Clostridium argentinense CDC 2741]NFF40082.1 ribonuclease E/G [Clostridium argentinense]NFP50218.1 ribonuclease E/G [Clostridium argentinense]NFP71859.1 ribonuclease E/G [Clostridium argentinense]
MKEIFIERQEDFLKVAVKEDNVLKGCYIEEQKHLPKISDIYKGVVKNIVPAIKCAFIDIGYKKNAYMYLNDNMRSIKKGDEVLVEVIKEEIGKKGPKVINSISLPGSYIVVTNSHNKIQFSPKIKDKNFIKYIEDSLDKPANIGVVIRTKGQNVDLSILKEEMSNLYNIYENIVRKFTYYQNIGLLYGSEGILGNILREISGDDYNIVVNNHIDFNYCKEFLNSKCHQGKIKIYDESIGLFDYYGIEKEILSLRNNKVVLPSGGNIVIEKTEAMYVIDVNSAKNVKSSSLRKTALVTNIEAAKTIAEQIKLRNLSGIILIDFIDLIEDNEKQDVINTLKRYFKDDKNKTTIYNFTELNLVQIARRRTGKSIYEYIFEECVSCKGKGVKIKLSYIENMIRNNIKRLNSEQNVKDIYIEVDEFYKNQIQRDLITFIKNINALDKCIYINYIHDLDTFKIEPLMFANQIRNLENCKIYG